MSDLNVALAVIGGLMLGLSLIVGLLKGKSYLPTQPIIAVLVGVLIGPEILGVLQLANWGDPMTILEQVARLTITFSVLGAALRIPRTYFSDRTKAMATLLGPGQIAMAGVSGLLAYFLLGIPFWVAMLIGTILTPTDPVLASTIVTGETATDNIPGRIRHALSGESGANDGGAYPLVFLSVFMIEYPFGQALSRWVTQSLLWDVLFAVLIGIALGAIAGKIQGWSLDHDYLEETPLFTVTIGLGLLVLGAVHWLGSDGILAVFAAGLAFNRVAPGDPETKEESATDIVERLFTIPIFVLFGMALPWGEWAALGWAGVVLAGAVLLLRRLPMVLSLRRFIPPLQNRSDAAFAGWFGPIGVAAIYYATLSTHELATNAGWVVGSLVIAASVLTFGIATTPLTKYYGREAGKRSSQDSQESTGGATTDGTT
jgi:NhaP-type Na+/H+ or K+/H+ antiporter